MRHRCTWRPLAEELPLWDKVAWYYDEWQPKGVWASIEDCLSRAVHEATGRNETPTAGSADSQTITPSKTQMMVLSTGSEIFLSRKPLEMETKEIVRKTAQKKGLRHLTQTLVLSANAEDRS